MKRLPILVIAVVFSASSLPQTSAQQVTTDGGTINAETAARYFKQPSYSPYAGRHYPTRVYWGDQHLHSSWSGDAGGSRTRVGPEEALRFARGEEVMSSTGQPVNSRAHWTGWLSRTTRTAWA